MATDPNFRIGTTFEGVSYIFDCRWNTRDEAWYLDLLAEDETPIRRGIKVVLGALLGGRAGHDPRFPAGVIVASDLSGEGREAGLDDLGTRVQLTIYPSSAFE